MILTVVRDYFKSGCTRGKLYLDGQFECFTLEDTVRIGPKVPGQTAIPVGAYKLIVNESPRFKRRLPLLVNVPGFEGIRIHPGNTAKDTEGCLLVGDRLGSESDIESSRTAFERLMAKIDGPDAHMIVILNHR